MSKAQIKELEKQLNFEPQDVDNMKPIDRKNYETLLIRLQKEA